MKKEQNWPLIVLQIETTEFERILNEDEIISMLPDVVEGKFISLFVTEDEPLETREGSLVFYLGFTLRHDHGKDKLIHPFRGPSLVIKVCSTQSDGEEPCFYSIILRQKGSHWSLHEITAQPADLENRKEESHFYTVTNRDKKTEILATVREMLEK